MLGVSLFVGGDEAEETRGQTVAMSRGERLVTWSVVGPSGLAALMAQDQMQARAVAANLNGVRILQGGPQGQQVWQQLGGPH